MFRVTRMIVGVGAVTIAALSSSTTYQLNSYSLNGGGTNSASSTTYSLQASTGETSSGSSASANLQAKSGNVQAQQANVPGAPTLDNGSGTYYNKLHIALDTAGNPIDTTFAIAVSTNNFATTSYAQVDGTLGPAPAYQTYTQWGSAGGTFITGLGAGTTYQAKVAAMQGKFTNSGFGPTASAVTASPSLTFSISPNNIAMGTLLAGSVISSPQNISVNFATNATAGGNVYIAGQNTGLKSTATAYTITALNADLSTQPQGFGAQVLTNSQTSGGPFNKLSPFNGSSAVVGGPIATYQTILNASAPVVGGVATVGLKAKTTTAVPAAADYAEILTMIAAASF